MPEHSKQQESDPPAMRISLLVVDSGPSLSKPSKTFANSY